MIFQHIVECTIDSHRSADGVVRCRACYRSAGVFVDFVESTHVDCPAVVGIDLFDEIAVAVVEELRGLTVHCDRDQAIFSIEGLSVGLSAFASGASAGIGFAGANVSGGVLEATSL